MSIQRLVKLLAKTEAEIDSAIRELQEEYAGRQGGMIIIIHDHKVQMGTNPANASYLRELLTSEMKEDLTPSSLETLTIIAYRGPITKSDIDYIRGVNSGFILRNLLMRGLIERRENEKDARSFIYSISFDLIKHLGLTNISELPNFEELSKKELM
jgi:segregation and condensation protein B